MLEKLDIVMSGLLEMIASSEMLELHGFGEGLFLLGMT